MLEEVDALDLDGRRLTVNPLGRRSDVPDDSLILATGADQSYDGHREFERDAPGMKATDAALELRGKTFRRVREYRCRGAAAESDRGSHQEPGGGRRASPLGRVTAEAAGAAVDHAGRVRVKPDCTLTGHPEVFVIADLMSLDLLPGVRQGRDPVPTPRRRDDHPQTAGRLHGAAIPLSQLFRLTGFKNLAVLSAWTIAFLSRQRPQRAITAQQVFGRQASEAQPAVISSGLGAFDAPRRG
jgi:hypothetical protein